MVATTESPMSIHGMKSVMHATMPAPGQSWHTHHARDGADLPVWLKPDMATKRAMMMVVLNLHLRPCVVGVECSSTRRTRTHGRHSICRRRRHMVGSEVSAVAGAVTLSRVDMVTSQRKQRGCTRTESMIRHRWRGVQIRTVRARCSSVGVATERRLPTRGSGWERRSQQRHLSHFEIC